MDKTDSQPRWMRILAEIPMLAMAVGMFVLLYRTVAPRLTYPYDLEWMEGGMLLHAARIADGQPLYVTPSVDFIPFIYTPLYPWIVGGLSTLGMPLDYTLGRSVSIICVIVAGLALALAVRKETGNVWLGVGGTALFLATFPDSGAFFDLARNDGLMVATLVCALLAIRTGWLRTGGLLLTASFLTKHTMALYGIPALWWLWQHQGKHASVRFVLWSVVPALLFVFGLQWHSDGLFLTYLLGVPSVHPFVADRFFVLAPKEMLTAVGWLLGAMLVTALMVRRPVSRGARFWIAQGMLALVLCAIMRGHHGGYLNVLMPGLWALCLWACLSIHQLRKRFPGLWMQVATAALVAWQLWIMQWNPNRYIPTEADKAAGDAVVAQLAKVDGEILAPWQPWMPVQAGKKGSIALIALWDIDHEGGPLEEEAKVIGEAIERHHWAAVLTARSELRRGLRQHYKRTRFEQPKGRALYPRTGWRVRPHSLWIPKKKDEKK